ncbi:MAG TPA: hypothetical protein VHU80_11205 [Polyangiaceae bacterium]|nr:hypothetical protein [Polyangiaceae bacterium]
MNILTRALLGSSVVALALVGTSGTALAAYHNNYDAHGGQGTLNAQFDYGFWTGDGDINAYGAGLGLRGGYTLDMGLYLGGDFDYFFGESNDVGIAGLGGASVGWNVWNIMAEVGYDFWVHKNGVLRPKLGLGVGSLHSHGCGNALTVGFCDGDSHSGFAIAPGVQYLHFFDNIYLSAELRYQTVSVSDDPDPSAFVFGIGVGVAL